MAGWRRALHTMSQSRFSIENTSWGVEPATVWHPVQGSSSTSDSLQAKETGTKQLGPLGLKKSFYRFLSKQIDSGFCADDRTNQTLSLLPLSSTSSLS